MLVVIVFLVRNIARHFNPVIGIVIVTAITPLVATVVAMAAISRTCQPTLFWQLLLLKKTPIAEPRCIANGPTSPTLGKSTISVQYTTGMRLPIGLLALIWLVLIRNVLSTGQRWAREDATGCSLLFLSGYYWGGRHNEIFVSRRRNSNGTTAFFTLLKLVAFGYFIPWPIRWPGQPLSAIAQHVLEVCPMMCTVRHI